MSPEFEELRSAYAAELRDAKREAERWWQQLRDTLARASGGPTAEDLWPMGPASHPWVIAVYRKYFFLCIELNARVRARGLRTQPDMPGEQDWGVDDISQQPADTTEPRIFVLDLLSGGDTHDLYEFLLSLTFIPVGLKGDVLA